jgi:hypothetical protein
MVSRDRQAVIPPVEIIDQAEENLGFEVRQFQLVDVFPEEMVRLHHRTTNHGAVPPTARFELPFGFVYVFSWHS